jgi:hypothetical protein
MEDESAGYISRYTRDEKCVQNFSSTIRREETAWKE